MPFRGLRTLGQIHLSVSDLDRAIASYRDTLGISFLFQVPGQPMAFFDCDGVRLYVGKPETREFGSLVDNAVMSRNDLVQSARLPGRGWPVDSRPVLGRTSSSRSTRSLDGSATPPSSFELSSLSLSVSHSRNQRPILVPRPQ
jgi:hypothetical protein